MKLSGLLLLVAVAGISIATTCDATCQLTMPDCEDYTATAHPTNTDMSEYKCNSCLNSLTPLTSKYYWNSKPQMKFLCDKTIYKYCQENDVCAAEFPMCNRIAVRFFTDPGMNRYFCQKCADGLYYPGVQLNSTTLEKKIVCGETKIPIFCWMLFVSLSIASLFI